MKKQLKPRYFSQIIRANPDPRHIVVSAMNARKGDHHERLPHHHHRRRFHGLHYSRRAVVYIMTHLELRQTLIDIYGPASDWKLSRLSCVDLYVTYRTVLYWLAGKPIPGPAIAYLELRQSITKPHKRPQERATLPAAYSLEGR